VVSSGRNGEQIEARHGSCRYNRLGQLGRERAAFVGGGRVGGQIEPSAGLTAASGYRGPPAEFHCEKAVRPNRALQCVRKPAVFTAPRSGSVLARPVVAPPLGCMPKSDSAALLSEPVT
jgi:hypothetical protein